jgi:hypothetical protein
MQGPFKKTKNKNRKHPIFFSKKAGRRADSLCAAAAQQPLVTAQSWGVVACPATAGRCGPSDLRSPPSPARVLHFACCLPLFFSFFPHFWILWSTPPHWLQPMPALSKLVLRIWNIHNFWSIGPKIMKFVFPKANCEMHVHKKFQKI